MANHWTGRKHSEETKQKIRDSMLSHTNPMKIKDVVKKRSKTLVDRGTFAGPNNNNWNGGDRKYRGVGWNCARNERRKLDNYKCVDCGKSEKEIKKSLDVHHIIDFKKGGSNSMNNLVSLCRSCHNKRRKLCRKV